jgi:hypothetical protein
MELVKYVAPRIYGARMQAFTAQMWLVSGYHTLWL